MMIPKLLIDTADMLIEWGCAKLNGDEGFGVLMVSHHADGKRMHNYSFNTTEEALAAATKELKGKWQDLTAYVLCYDVTINFPSAPERGFLLEAQDNRSDIMFVIFHGTAQSPSGEWSAIGEYRLLETREERNTAQQAGGG